jgi:two-component system, NtrC family, sensor kinase
MAQDLDARLIELSLSLFGGGGRRSYPGDEILVHEGDDPGGIWLILKGRVELFRSIGGEDVIFHFESAGRLVGLLSLAGRQPSLFSCRAKGPVEALFITHDEIRRGLQESTEFGTWLLRVMVHSLGRRNRRSAELLVEVHVLNQRLEAQRDELQAALEHLQRAQLQIIESEKMATLGNLSAGMAHELNNPVAAILRATEFIAKDLSALLAETPGLATAAAALPLAMRQQPMSTSEERETKARLAASLGGDRALASRLFSSGIRTTGDLEALLDPPSPEPRAERLRQIERGGQLGASLRSLDHCSRRIADLVRSLKLYARDDDDRIEGIDLNQTLEDTLLLLSGKLQGIEVEKHYDRLPPVAGHPSRLQQVWVNLIVNAAQALPGKGRIVLRTRLRPDGWIEVAIEDNGHGIPEEVQSRLFEHRFTTRGGRVEFGLGFGLPICRMIVENHGGRLSFESVPGHTVFRVALPADPAFPSTPPTPA